MLMSKRSFFYPGSFMADLLGLKQVFDEIKPVLIEFLFDVFQRCVQLFDGHWSVESCETKAKFVCEHVSTTVRCV